MLLCRDARGACAAPDVAIAIYVSLYIPLPLFGSYRVGDDSSAQRAYWWHFDTWSGWLLSDLYLYEEAGYGGFGAGDWCGVVL